MSEIIEMIAGAMILFAVNAIVYFLLVAMGPPKHLYCENGQRHKWGNWTFSHGMNVRTCKNCGYTTMAD